MEPWRFDLEQIRRNWQQDAALPSDPLPQKFARVEAPGEPYEQAAALLGRVRALARVELSAHEPTLRPFFEEAAKLIGLLSSESGEGEPKDKAALRAELDEVLGHLEDMLALLRGIGQQP